MNGTYHYWMNGTQTDSTETFRVTPNDEVDSVMDAEYNAPALNARIAAQASYQNGRISHFEIEWQNDEPDAVRFASAHYQFTTDKIIVNRNIDEQAFLETLPMPEVFIVLPLLKAFTGKAIREAFELGRGNRVPVLVPNTRDPKDKIQLLALELDMRSANRIGHEVVTVNNEEHSTDIFNFASHGGQDAKFWVAENGILLKHEWQEYPDRSWETRLVSYGK